ncbi:alpha/beta fold hydrolase [Actinoalloteichus hymeniacidonis]|uniref:Hydrolase or acyltransferase of alpha/beta superfamily n=1 Tax=Actinoalloteichus hymeniacidonis TaxID=340345 RepID=A0AAC9MZA5_9PSEU|nr:alpha/beta fold hydrolase [Actinoalloteichus hymeniacidonis]AOS64140.1 putative hydrolase or acyltransferase of alpha/beta superfamily [Actinoalloteichus hymeniacidonis]MBB5907794.1 pimeloyl-ACP methyl ester carboxylesterase [Actinoalloteichus hymeniacidonis]
MPYAIAPDGCRIAYQVEGQGLPLVLLAGQSNNHHWWDGIREDFHATHQTITLDYRGTGDSDEPPGPYSTEGLADDVIAILDDLGVDRADVYGTSMGGRVAQWVAARHPDRVRRLVLGCTSPGRGHGIERDNSIRAALSDRDRAVVRQTLIDLMYTPAWQATHPGPHNTLGDRNLTSNARRAHLMASHRHDAWDALPQITAPTLVVHGTEDVFNPVANAPLLTERIPHARMQLIEGARHAYFEEFREVAGPLVRDFLAD